MSPLRNQNLRQNIFKNNSSALCSYFNFVKTYLRIGYFIGVCPLQNVFSAKSSQELKNKIISMNYFYSLLLYVYKVTATLQLWYLLLTFGDRSVYIRQQEQYTTTTDIIASTLCFTFTFCFGIVAQIMTVSTLPNYLRVLQEIETFEDKCPKRDCTNPKIYSIKNSHLRKLLIQALVSGLLIYSPFRLSYEITLQNDRDLGLMIFPGIYITSKIFIFFYLIVAFVLRELGAAFVYTQIFSTSVRLGNHLDYIIQLVEQKSRNADSTLALSPQNSGRTWAGITQEYMGFKNMFEKFQTFSAPYFVTLLSTLIISAVCLVYVLANPEISGGRGPVQLVMAIVFVRISHLSDCGEKYQQKYKVLLKSVMVASLGQIEGSQDAAELEQFKGLMNSVITEKIYLRAGGFFTVSRKNFTSIISVILTYVIVLLQFRGQDKNRLTSWRQYYIAESSDFATNFNISEQGI